MKIVIEKYEGPLDLLLQLIEEQKLDITQISLASVTEQFLDYMKSLDDLRPHELADWLAIAAKLILIKSKALMPTLELTEEEEEDAQALAWQLYQFKRYKEIAKALGEMDEKKQQSWSRQSTSNVSTVSFFPDSSINQATLRDTANYLAKMLAKIQTVPKKVLEEVVTISEKIETMKTMIVEKVQTRLHDLIKNAKSKTEVIVTFLALLEMVKQRTLSVKQEMMFSDIIITRNQKE